MTEHISMNTVRRQALFWLGAVLVVCAFVYVFSSVLLPFFAGLALAYFLDPVADYLEKRGFSRMWATVTILVTFLVLFVVALFAVVPVLGRQIAEFVDSMPTYYANLRELLNSLIASAPWLGELLAEQNGELGQSLNELLNQAAGVGAQVLGGIWSSANAVLSILGLLVVTPVVAFYMLLDWDKMIATIDSWVPRNHLKDVRRIGREINEAIAGFVRGQGTVCLILAVFYGVALSVVGLNFGLLIGLIAGLISFIPYVGSIVGLVLSVGVAIVQYWPDAASVASDGYTGSLINIGIVAAIFFGGQLVEGNILQPKLVGESVGLHPVWLMFALFAFGSLLGFTGMLIAVPAAAAVGVLVRFALERYLGSDLYMGHGTADVPDRDNEAA
ncbi:MAG: AI-2E family transporter [Pseudomonadota bacterium]